MNKFLGFTFLFMWIVIFATVIKLHTEKIEELTLRVDTLEDSFPVIAAFATTDDLISAIIHVESGGNDNAIGDNGASIGPMQISEAYFIDACEINSSLHEYKSCTNRAYARSVFMAYMQRWLPAQVFESLKNGALNERECEIIARIHNGGPRGASKESTLPYWDKIREQLR